MKAPAPHRFNVEDYYRLGETGILAPDAQVELLDGEIFDIPPATPFHSGVNRRLNEFFSRRTSVRWIVSARNPVRLNNFSEPRPDLAFLEPVPDYYASNHPEPDNVLLLIEVADSSLEFDRLKKLPIYAQAGIRELWIVNLQQLKVEVYREPHIMSYEKTTIFRAGDHASPITFPDVKLDVAELLHK